MNFTKYRPFQPIPMSQRSWPDKLITKAPMWCSVDLRDGNQALEIPMSLEQKIEFFEHLVAIGFKEIEIGFPAASETEYLFTRTLIEQNLIPKDVTIQVLTQSRDQIIKRTFESLQGVHRAIVHLYNSTSTLQRAVVFQKNKEEIKEIAVSGAKLLKEYAQQYGPERFLFEYSPESFTGTEIDYAADICNAVLDVWQPTPQHKSIINLPATVEMSTPNIYADQIETMCKTIKGRQNVIISLHTHNDRGTAVAAAELGLMAGADRVEGTLFGNGERTGNSDVLTLAMNLYSQGINPQLDFSVIDKIVEIYQDMTHMVVHPRHPYAGELVFTAFSGSHQDAINKGIAQLNKDASYWEVPYLPIDPSDIGRSYEAIIRINSQSGKGGIAYVLEKKYGLQLPKKMRQHFSQIIKDASDKLHKEMLVEEIYDLFCKEYINVASPVELVSYKEESGTETNVSAVLIINGVQKTISGSGNGLLSAFCSGLIAATQKEFEIKYYTEHSLEYGAKSSAITYMEVIDKAGELYFGAGVDSNISRSSILAIISAANKIL